MPLLAQTSRATEVPLLNSASPWASTLEDLEQLWQCEFSDAITTRTATLTGYPDDPAKHQVAFFGTKNNSINSFGFSPYPLKQYLEWLDQILSKDPNSRKRHEKRIIVSIGPADGQELQVSLDLVHGFAQKHNIVVGVEFNASCPNLNGLPPPAYNAQLLENYIRIFAERSYSDLQLGFKLPPYTYEEQIVSVVRAIERATSSAPHDREVVSFLTSTNTLGQGLVYASQIVEPDRDDTRAQSLKPASEEFGVPTGYGGIAGEAIHQISLGNVHRLRKLLDASREPRVRGITLIGVGGACDRASVERFRQAGADAVAIATALGREGVKVFRKIRIERSKL
ncbi:uncharacterized protein JCM15063_004374 [Sporobolomyces koalae]|uniref:uncharacterized protein n=1 Tax=Sporobolomyces koalae TaxID=500713 RepID=UPI00316D4321